MKMTGHKTESVYRRHVIIDEAILRESVKKLAAFHSNTLTGIFPLKSRKATT